MEEFYKLESRTWKKPKWPFILIGVIVLALIATAVFVAVRISSNEYLIDLTMKGQAEITLEYGETFEDPGAEATGCGTVLKKDPTALEVEVEGKVDADKVGTYTLTYTATFQDAKATATRKVTIADTQAPVITLVSDPEAFTVPGQEYEEEGFSAIDNYDGDITDLVECKVEDGTVTYTVSDSSGNRTEVTRTIVYKDPEAPELTLKGKKKITMNAGKKWTEPGYSATDNVDGDLTDSVKISGKVDIYVPGTYRITYKVSDAYGNETTARRTIVVKAVEQPEAEEPDAPQTPDTQVKPDKPAQPNGKGKVIYLTFDDGPGKHTERLLGVLKKYNVKATFFVCKTGYLDLLDDIVKDGHSIAIHSVTHNYEQIYKSEDAFFEDLYGMQSIIYEYTGVKTTLMRFPGGASNSISKRINKGIMTRLTKAVEAQGFQYFDWNVDSNDAGGAKTSGEVVRNVINNISGSSKNNFFVLQHDIHGFSVDAVEQIISWGLSHGYTFLPLEPTSPVCHHTPVN